MGGGLFYISVFFDFNNGIIIIIDTTGNTVNFPKKNEEKRRLAVGEATPDNKRGQVVRNSIAVDCEAVRDAPASH